MGYDRVEQVWEGILGDGLEGNFWEERLPFCFQSKVECLHGCSGHNILWQLVTVWHYSDAERMLATTSLTETFGLTVLSTAFLNAPKATIYSTKCQCAKTMSVFIKQKFRIAWLQVLNLFDWMQIVFCMVN